MIQRSQHLRFALEPRQPISIMCKGFGQYFDRYVAAEFGVVRLIHLAHPTRTDRGENFIGP